MEPSGKLFLGSSLFYLSNDSRTSILVWYLVRTAVCQKPIFYTIWWILMNRDDQFISKLKLCESMKIIYIIYFSILYCHNYMSPLLGYINSQFVLFSVSFSIGWYKEKYAKKKKKPFNYGLVEFNPINHRNMELQLWTVVNL